MKSMMRVFALGVALAVIAGPAAWAGLAEPSFSPGGVQWATQVAYERAVLTVSTPGGMVHRQEIEAGQALAFDLSSLEDVADGSYTYELRLVPRVGGETRKALAEARRNGDEAAMERLTAELKPQDRVQSGSFLVQGGAVFVPEGEERGGRGMKSAAEAMRNVTAQDVVYNDDLIVTGSACVGFDCVNGESFGFDTIRLKENNLRIKFEDTSASAGFPTTDWQLTANDSASGGLNKFSIEDITSAKVPFTVVGGATTNSIYVDSTGRVGFRTSTPVLDLHVSTSNTPGIRLEQNNSGGFTAQTWDIAGNEANFFVRDVTGGSRLPFRIRPGAPTSSIDINATGNVGIGTTTASEALHVKGSDGDTTIQVEETNGTATARVMLNLVNNGDVQMNYNDTSTGALWGVNVIAGDFKIQKAGGPANPVFLLNGSGNLTIGGTLTQNSDRDAKTNFVTVSPDEVLAKVASLPISEWTYKNDDPSVRHLGPMAQDFAAAFGLGDNERKIAPLDVAGVSLAAIQALHKEVTEKDAELTSLRRQNDELAQRLADLEALVASLAVQQQ